MAGFLIVHNLYQPLKTTSCFFFIVLDWGVSRALLPQTGFMAGSKLVQRHHPRLFESHNNRRSCVRADVSYVESCQARNGAAVKHKTRVVRVAQRRKLCVPQSIADCPCTGAHFILNTFILDIVNFLQ